MKNSLQNDQIINSKLEPEFSKVGNNETFALIVYNNDQKITNTSPSLKSKLPDWLLYRKSLFSRSDTRILPSHCCIDHKTNPLEG